MRRIELYLLALLVAITSLAAYLGAQSGWSDELADPRLSTHLSGPRGARALAQTLIALGVTVEHRERAYFTVADSASAKLFAFLDPTTRLTPREMLRVSTMAARGGHLALVGRTGLEPCFGLRVVPAGESLPVMLANATSPDDALPAVRRTYAAIGPDEAAAADDESCARTAVAAADTLLTVPAGEAEAVTLALEGGGSVKLVADGMLFSNEALRNSDAGAVLIPWLLAPNHRTIVVDEYHHGFQGDASLSGAAWHWLRTSPFGWTILQLFAVSILAMFALGARFGPPLPYIRVARRSELEHVNALGVGLRNAGGHQTAIDLLYNGLRRRLGRSEFAGGQPSADHSWMNAFDHLDSPDVQRALETLRSVNHEPVATRVRTAAVAVEDLWTAMTNKP